VEPWFYPRKARKRRTGDWLLFGYVIGLEEEWGYFLLFRNWRASEGPLGVSCGARSLVFNRAPLMEWYFVASDRVNKENSHFLN